MADGYSKGIPFESDGVIDVQVNGTSVVSNGVAEIPIAGVDQLGLVKKVNPAQDGIGINNDGTLVIYGATAGHIKTGTANYLPIVAGHQHESTFYGLAKAAGDATQSASSNAVGTYTESAKSAILDMLNGAVQISGTDPTINAMSGIRYVCGEVLSLNFIPSANGICDVVFTSGSTPTVVTLPSTVKFPDGSFTAEADTTYEINILDGVYGAVMSWT